MERSTEALYLCIDREVPMDLSLILASCFISLVGLPHGALDPVVAYRNGLINDWRSIIQFLVLYTGIVAAVVGLWILAPVISLIVFLLISSLHFGRDWRTKISLGGFGYGAFILGLPAWTHAQQVSEIFGFLVFGASSAFPLIVLQAVGALGLLLLAFDLRRLSWIRKLELILLASIAWTLEPLWYFVVYFCAFHSPRHLIAEFRQMRPETRLTAYIVVLTITIATLAIAAVSGSHIERYADRVDIVIYQVLFIGLAALTVPHMCLLEWVGRKHHE